MHISENRRTQRKMMACRDFTATHSHEWLSHQNGARCIGSRAPTGRLAFPGNGDGAGGTPAYRQAGRRYERRGGLNGSMQHHLIWNFRSKVVFMTQGQRVALSAAQRTELWSRWKAGESLHTIGRAFDRPHTSIHGFLAHHGGIVPAVRRRAVRALTVVEREDISRGIASGSSLRDIAKVLERAASTVSREVARHGGRPEYRAQQADHQAWESALRPKRCLLAIHVKLRKLVASKLILD